jgi:hypothetical protein
MIPISTWYDSLGQFSFPTAFVKLRRAEVEAFLRSDPEDAAARDVIARMQLLMRDLPGSCFVSADVCAPTDSESYGTGPSIAYGLVAWRLLTGSQKVRSAFEQGLTERITIRPFRRMNRTREFRLFFQKRTLVGMSQYNLDRHFARLAKRERELWRRAVKFAEQILDFLPADDLVVDVYFTSDDQVLIVDLNPWGSPTDPLLFKTWDRDWNGESSDIKLIPGPVKMKGEVSVSF